MKPLEKRWPAQQAPDDFADRVVHAGLSASRADFAEVEPLFRRASRRFFWRAALGWGVAAALAVGAFALYFAKVRAEAEARKDFATARWVQAQAEVARQARALDELHAKVAKLEDDLLQERLRAKLSVPQKQMSAAAPSARAAASRPACNCTPGDPLCTCL